jgi:hypothetical protein
MFERLIDDDVAAKVRRDPRGDTEFLRSAPLLEDEQARSLRSVDRGAGPVDRDLGRSLNSTPRLERTLKGYWGDRGDLEEDDPVENAKDDNFISGYTKTAERAFSAGSRAGKRADEYRNKFASIRKRRFGGFLNFNNWGWVRRMRERKLRAQMNAEFGAPAQSPANVPAAAVPDDVGQEAAAELGSAPSAPVPRHRTAVPQKSALKVRGGRQHTPDTLLPKAVEANERVDQAVETESAAGAPFAQGGAHFKKLDAQHDGKKARFAGLPQAANPLLTGQLLFGAQPAQRPAAPVDGEDALKTYGTAMESSYSAEQKRRAAASAQTSADQGDLAAPLYGRKVAARSNFWNGYWSAEQANAKPTSRARAGKRVQFSEPDEEDLMDKSDPNRPFAKKDAKHNASKSARRSKLDESLAAYLAAHPDEAKNAEQDGRERHAQEPVVQFPDNDPLIHSSNDTGAENVQPGMIEEEEKDADYWNR